MADALRVNGSMTECKLCNNDLGLEGWTSIFNALRDSPNSKISKWDISAEKLGPEIAKPLAEYIAVTGSMTRCNVLQNNIDVAAAESLVAAVKDKDISLADIKDLTTAMFADLGLKPPDAVLLASDLSKAGVAGSITRLNVKRNRLGDEGEAVLRKAIEGRIGFELLVL